MKLLIAWWAAAVSKRKIVGVCQGGDREAAEFSSESVAYEEVRPLVVLSREGGDVMLKEFKSFLVEKPLVLFFHPEWGGSELS